MNRRTFLASAAATAFASQIPAKKAHGANDTIRVGCIGTGGRGRSHASGLAAMDGVEVAWLCDVNEDQLGSLPGRIGSQQGAIPKTCTDMQTIMDDKDVDAVFISTPDHWHALATVWACQAGKDVYVEKPACNSIWEGMKMIEAARKYDRVVQVGSQNRSGAYTHSAHDYIQSGKLGGVHMVKVFNMEDGSRWTMDEDQDAPDTIDWNLFRGPAPMRPFNPALIKNGGWKRFWETGGGDTTDDSVHQLDVARYLIGDPAAPKRTTAQGGMIAYPDSDGEAPDTLTAAFSYDGVLMTFDLTQWAGHMRKIPGEVRGTDKFPQWMFCSSRIEIYGTEARMYFGRQGGGWQVLAPDDVVIDEFPGREPSQDHRANFIECMRTREKPNADIEIGVQSCLLGHLANIGVRCGGSMLDFDLDSLTFDGNEKAQSIVKCAYRDGFEVPDKV